MLPPGVPEGRRRDQLLLRQVVTAKIFFFGAVDLTENRQGRPVHVSTVNASAEQRTTVVGPGPVTFCRQVLIVLPVHTRLSF
jgi:hypothetical protein